MTPKHLLPLLVIAALAGAPTLAAGDDPAQDAAHAHEDDHGHEDDHEHDQEHGHDDDPAADDHLSTIGDVRLLHGWTRATGDDSALIFVEIENDGTTPVTLIGGASDLAEGAVLVGFTTVNGAPTYQELPALPVAPGTEMVLAPQGVALRLEGLSRDLDEGDSFEVIISFAEADVALSVEVEAANATQHSHAGHAH